MLYYLSVLLLFDCMQVIFTIMINFATWQLFVYHYLAVTKAGQVTKSIIVVKITCI